MNPLFPDGSELVSVKYDISRGQWRGLIQTTRQIDWPLRDKEPEYHQFTSALPMSTPQVSTIPSDIVHSVVPRWDPCHSSGNHTAVPKYMQCVLPGHMCFATYPRRFVDRAAALGIASRREP